jgi:hypothetical protein
MASKLDEGIARLAVVIGGRDRAEMDRVAAEVMAALKPKDLAKFPDRWYPAFSAKKAGSPELHDSWDHLWFEALTELLYQRKDDSTYHQFVLVRLLRFAADGVEPETILSRVRARLETLHYTKTRESVREVTYWKLTDPRPVELLRRMADVVCPRSDGDTVGLYLTEMGEELPVHLARMKEQQG